MTLRAAASRCRTMGESSPITSTGSRIERVACRSPSEPSSSDAVVAAFNTERQGGSGSSRAPFAVIRDRALDLIK
jgi:hypothetical protein